MSALSAITVSAAGVRAKRQALGLSRRELALLGGIPVDVIWQIEDGVWSPDPRQRAALMRSLDAE